MRRDLLTAVLVPLFPVPATSFAETPMPSQEDNIWARHDNQPGGGGRAAERENRRHGAVALNAVAVTAAPTRSGALERETATRNRFWATVSAAKARAAAGAVSLARGDA
jgi:hypothetical protein